MGKNNKQKEYLFSLNMGYKQHLGDGPVSNDLRNAFNSNKLSLSSEAKITKEVDKYWKIKDGNKTFEIEDNGTQLNIYQKDNRRFERGCLFIDSHKVFVGSLILVFGFAASVFIAYLLCSAIPRSLIGIGIMGIGILITVLIGGNVLSKENELTTGEVRRAIALSCISVFFGLLAFGDTIETNNKVLETVLENFWWIIITIIGFYFGGRSAEKIVESISEKWAKRLEDKVENIKKDLDEVKKE